jgi:hypothetical protein
MNEPLTPEASNLSTFFSLHQSCSGDSGHILPESLVMHQAVPMFFIPSRGAAFKDHGIAASTMHSNGQHLHMHSSTQKYTTWILSQNFRFMFNWFHSFQPPLLGSS